METGTRLLSPYSKIVCGFNGMRVSRPAFPTCSQFINDSSGNGPNFQLETDLRNVLWAHLSDDRKLAISFLVKKRNKRGHLYLLNVGGPVRHNEVEETAEFVEALMKEAYRGALLLFW